MAVPAVFSRCTAAGVPAAGTLPHETPGGWLVGAAGEFAPQPALAMREITEALQLFQLSNRNWYIIDTRALHEDPAESNLHSGLDWLVETLNIPSAMRQEKAKLEHNERVKQANEGAGSKKR